MKLTSKINFSTDPLLIIALASLLGSICYWLFGLTLFGRIATLLGTAIIYFIIYRNRPLSQAKSINYYHWNWPNLLLLTLLIFSGLYLYFHRSQLPLQTPWSEVNFLFWLSYGLAAFLGLLLCRSKYQISSFNIRLWWLITFGVASFVYFSSFGFDPFIHQAAEKTIASQGVIEPKTPYYIGQYSLVVLINWLARIDISLIERWLLPILISFFLPTLLANWFKNNNLTATKEKIIIWLLPILGWPIFIVTNPQNCAYFFLLSTILFATINSKDKIFPWLTALASLACQPLAGLPALTIAILNTSPTFNRSQKIKNLTIWSGLSLTLFILPLSFWYANWQQTNSWSLSFPPFPELLSWLNNFTNWSNLWPNQEHLWLNLIYSWQTWQKIIVVLLIISGYKIAKKEHAHLVKLIRPISLSVLASLVLTSFIPFDFLISYERYNYLLRFIWVFLIINLPLILLALNKLTDAWLQHKNNRLFIGSTSLVLSILLVFSLYLNYPRLDKYSNAKGLSVGAADLAAVIWIEENASQNYLVLANQQVSAAALGHYGFYSGKHSRYLKDSFFYYPIPTSGILYEYYLKMVNDYPSRDTIKKAAELAGVKEAYLVLNKYWYGFEKLISEARTEADSMKEINNQQTVIFTYRFD
ncbi:MAG TPA: hypothetical protein PLT32_00830 [bacterium]|nr:hypothetical protein [bacterium]